MQCTRRDRKTRIGNLGLPLGNAGPGFATKDHLFQIALEKRRRLGEVVDRIAAQHLLPDLAVGGAGIFGQHLHQGESEHALRFSVRLPFWQVLFRRHLIGLGGKEGDKAAIFAGGRVKRSLDPIARITNAAADDILHRLGVHPEGFGRKLAGADIVVLDLQPARDCAGMAAVEDRPDIGALGPQGVDHHADLVVDQGVFHLADLVGPGPDVHRQEQFVQTIKFRVRVLGRRLRAMAGKVEIDEIARLRPFGQFGKGGSNRLECRVFVAIDPVGQDGNVLWRKGHRRVGGQIFGHQLHIVCRALQPPALGEVLILVRPDQDGVVFPCKCRKRGKAEG